MPGGAVCGRNQLNKSPLLVHVVVRQLHPQVQLLQSVVRHAHLAALAVHVRKGAHDYPNIHVRDRLAPVHPVVPALLPLQLKSKRLRGLHLSHNIPPAVAHLAGARARRA